MERQSLPTDGWIVREHCRRNAVNRQLSESYQHHRSRVMNCLIPKTVDTYLTTSKRVINIWGAGNCNDISLDQLHACYGAVHLTDLDDAALAMALQHHSPRTERPAVESHAPIDVTGVVHLLEMWRNRVTTIDSRVLAEQLLDAIHSHSLVAKLPRSHITVSLCLLSQIIDSVAVSIPQDDAHFFPILLAVRDRHLELLVEQTEVGGEVWLITDFVSSQTYPPLERMSDTDLSHAVGSLIATKNFFTGINPSTLPRRFSELPSLTNRLRGVETCPPWCWHLGAKTFAVAAIHAFV